MARFTYIDNHSARDNETGETLWVITLPVQYIHLRANRLIAEHEGLTLAFTPTRHLDDLVAFGVDKPEQRRRIAVQRRKHEAGRPHLVVVAVQAAEGSEEYVECTVDPTT